MNNILSSTIQKLPMRYITRIVGMQSLLILLALIIAGAYGHFKLKDYIIKDSSEKIFQSLDVMSQIIAQDSIPLADLCTWMPNKNINRFTIIDSTGIVICDNLHNPKQMENHATRPEIVEAKKTGKGISIHSSHTLLLKMIYGAKQIEHKNNTYYIRQSLSLTNLNSAISSIDRVILLILFPILIISLLAGAWVAIKTRRPLQIFTEKILQIRSKMTGTNDNQTNDQSMLPGNESWPIIEKMLDDTNNDISSLMQKISTENTKLSILMNNIPDGIAAISPSGKIIFHNQAFNQFFMSSGNVKELSISKIISDRTILDGIKQALETKSVQHFSKIKLNSINKQELCDFSVSIIPLQLADELNFLLVFQDISHIELAVAMRENFVSNVSHEIKTPLAALKGYLQLAQKSETDVAPLLEKMHSEMNRMSAIFDDLMNLSILESTNEIAKDYYPVEMLTDNAIENLKKLFSNKNVSLQTNYLTQNVFGNDRLIEQLISNLVDNAYKYTPANGTISLTWKETTRCIVLEVCDSGVGIAPQFQTRIFERFYRIDPARSKEIGGTGLGLAIVKHIVQKHRGEIIVESEPNKGSTFIVKFPLPFEEV